MHTPDCGFDCDTGSILPSTGAVRDRLAQRLYEIANGTLIDEPDKPFTLRAVRGVVLDASGAEMDGVVVEIRDEAGRIRGTKTNSKGTFKLSGVSKGTYKFKVTMNGFQSVVGNIIISKKANKTDQMKIAMKVGV
jgi:hypothetical protein